MTSTGNATERDWMNTLMAALEVYGYATKHDYRDDERVRLIHATAC